MEPLLKTIAREYSRRYSNLKDICFLFPNKRCITFLRKYFLEYNITTEDLPHILTVSEMVSQITLRKEAEKIPQLFTLFNCYKQLLQQDSDEKPENIDFDSFRSWGETVLADFNTVDLNMADPEEIFKNVKDYREIASNFLSETQKEVMREYFGVEDFGNPEEFWKNFNDIENLSGLKKNFINLWQILAPLHSLFIQTLDTKKLGTTGSIYKAAADKLTEKGRDALPYKKVVAVGFNALTESERRMFKALKDSEGYPGYDEYIDFIWDSFGPFLNSNEFNASRFVDFNKKMFPMPEWLSTTLESLEDDHIPEIRIITAASHTSQAKIVSEVLRQFSSPKGKKAMEEADVAVILPDETLLSPMLYSIPDFINDVNLTMGVSLRLSLISSLMAHLRRVYATHRQVKKDASQTETVFYVKDLKILFSHPFCYILFPAPQIEALFSYIEENHKVSIKLSEIEKIIPEASILLKFPDKDCPGQLILDFTINLLDSLGRKMEEDDNTANNLNELDHIRVYGEYVNTLKESVTEHNIEISPLSLLQLADRMIGAEKIGFEGEPLIGLQVMGTLETRSLDFKNIIITSMNEGIMPRKATNSTFIPETLRKAYALPPSHYAEEIFGYYFYRLISRADNVTLIYDGRSGAGMKGGVSRYILQLREYAPKDKIHEEVWKYDMNEAEGADWEIKKTPEVFRLIQAFSSDDPDKKNFSASTLDTYRECGMKFFLQNIMNLNTDPRQANFMDSISIGNILHEAMMDLYMPKDLQKKFLKYPLLMTKEFSTGLLEDSDIIRNTVINKINKIYYKGNRTHNTLESGVLEMMSQQLEELIREVVKYDLQLAPFKLYGCEISRNLKVKLSSGREVNFRFAIDRLDEINTPDGPKLRIVDYKTGSRHREDKSLQEMFEGSRSSKQIFQLFTYAWLLGKIGVDRWEDVITEIYFVPDLISGEGGLPKIAGKKVSSFKPFIEEFNQGIERMVESIFVDPEFKKTENPDTCRNCNFKSFCEKVR